jgi:hypothetical protein
MENYDNIIESRFEMVYMFVYSIGNIFVLIVDFMTRLLDGKRFNFLSTKWTKYIDIIDTGGAESPVTCSSKPLPRFL